MIKLIISMPVFYHCFTCLMLLLVCCFCSDFTNLCPRDLSMKKVDSNNKIACKKEDVCIEVEDACIEARDKKDDKVESNYQTTTSHAAHSDSPASTRQVI